MKQQKSKLKKIKREVSRLQEECKKEIMVDLVDIKGQSLGQTFVLKFDTTTEKMNLLLQNELKDSENDFSFYYKNYELRDSLKELLTEFKTKDLETEKTLQINYIPDSLMGIRPITRISSSLEGHTKSVLDVAFSPNNKYLASCSGDKTVRLWDVTTETPVFKFEGIHKNWVLAIAWSQDSQKIASGDYNGLIVVNKVFDGIGKKKGIEAQQKIQNSKDFYENKNGKLILRTSHSQRTQVLDYKSCLLSISFKS
jgi:ribosome assembly protein 4